MAITNGKSTGMVSLLFLYLFGGLCRHSVCLKQVTFQEVDALVYREQSRQWAELSAVSPQQEWTSSESENSIKEPLPMGFRGLPTNSKSG